MGLEETCLEVTMAMAALLPKWHGMEGTGQIKMGRRLAGPKWGISKHGVQTLARARGFMDESREDISNGIARTAAVYLYTLLL